MNENQDPFYLHQALELAKIRRGFCAPNPSVGCVIVREHKIIATGFHFAAGQPHAEPDALKKINHDAKEATAYVTLEPCCHFGRTPPCTDALIKSGVKRVVYGFRDPNPIVAGKGEAAIKAAGIECEFVPIPEINSFYESYRYWHQTQKPFLTAKIAMTLDGKIAGKLGERIQITGAALGEYTHYCRKNTDAILTTAKTIIHDDPQMNARYENQIIPKKIYILDSDLNLPLKSQIFHTAKSMTVFHAEEFLQDRQQALIEHGVTCIPVARKQEGLDLQQVISVMGKEGMHDVWIEAGGKSISAFLKQNLLQRALFYIAPRVMGEGMSAFSEPFDFRAQQVRWQQVGHDVMCDVNWG
jgi:diaminohydroxyphosphoribosylaminopyrimidine deaminase/5-amino-6-(5-phosphoribosylamino)uracil reductase